MTANLAELRSSELYNSPARYQRAVADINHLLEINGRRHNLAINLANYQEDKLSPLKSCDLLRISRTVYAAKAPAESPANATL